jgi:hypothetical protein
MNQVLKEDVETNKEEKNTDVIYFLFLKYLIYFFLQLTSSLSTKTWAKTKHKQKSKVAKLFKFCKVKVKK